MAPSKKKTWKVPAGLSVYTVREVQKLIDDDGDEIQGLCEYDKKRISISAAGSDGAIVLAFWHEYMHAALHELGFDDQGDSETFVESLSNSVARAIMAAPEKFVRKQEQQP